MGTSRRHGGRWAAVAGAALLVAAGAGCATEADPEAYADLVTEAREGEAPGARASAAFLAEAGERSTGEAYRVSMSMSVSVTGGDDEATESFGFDGEVMTGAQDGDAYEFHMDMRGPVADLGLDATDVFSGADLSMDIVGDTETAYIRAPIFAEVAGLVAAPGAGDEAVDDWMAELGGLGDRWGRVDLTALGDVAAGDIQDSMTGSGDPRAMLDMLGEASDTEDLGTDVIDGVEVHGTRFVVSLDELLGDDGASGYMPGEPSDDGVIQSFETFGASFLDDVPVEAWVDGDGYVRRVSYEVDMGEMLDGFAGSGGADEGDDAADGAGAGFSMVMGTTVDFSDYGDPGIEIVFPDESETVDLTETFRAMAEGG